jgi:hypothetical protein
MTLNVNQFGISNLPGNLALTTGFNNVISCLFDPTLDEDKVLLPGEAVKLVDLGASDMSSTAPIVGKRLAATDTSLWGVVVRTAKSSTTKPGNIVDVARNGTVISLVATAPLNRGALVTPDFVNPGNVILASNTSADVAVLGVTLDKAINAGDIIRVEINTYTLLKPPPPPSTGD